MELSLLFQLPHQLELHANEDRLFSKTPMLPGCLTKDKRHFHTPRAIKRHAQSTACTQRLPHLPHTITKLPRAHLLSSQSLLAVAFPQGHHAGYERPPVWPYKRGCRSFKEGLAIILKKGVRWLKKKKKGWLFRFRREGGES